MGEEEAVEVQSEPQAADVAEGPEVDAAPPEAAGQDVAPADETPDAGEAEAPSGAADPLADLGGEAFADTVEFDAFDQVEPVSDEVRRILRLRVPVIVKLADKELSLGDIVDLSPGSIVEFSRSADTPLELLVNNKVIGRGSAVKVGEKFGLRIDEIMPVAETIRSLGT